MTSKQTVAAQRHTERLRIIKEKVSSSLKETVVLSAVLSLFTLQMMGLTLLRANESRGVWFKEEAQ